MTFYLKYRPKSLDELDLPEVRESLRKIVVSKNIPHAFLFAGPKGTGKTSAARILAKIVNCESKNPPCDKCEQCLSITKGNNLDVIEMDAASHRGIDDVRVLRDAVKLSPTRAKKKIYIIDEAHMLTTEASNALLKILEEPPSHVIFILATTNAEKLIDTIRSRVTLIPFRKAKTEEIEHSLERVIKSEKIKVNGDTLKSIAKAANGSFRDGVKILEQYGLEGQGFLIKNDISDVERFTGFLYEKDAEKSLGYIHEILENGKSVEILIKNTLSKIQGNILENISGKRNLIELLELLIEANRQIADSPIEELPLEIAVIKWCQRKENGVERIAIREEKQEKKENVNEETWKSILSLIKPVNASVEALLRATRPVNYDGKTLTLGVYYKFHKERLEDNQHRSVLEDIVTRVLQSPTKIVCTLVEPPLKVQPVLTETKDNDIIKIAEEIFGN